MILFENVSKHFKQQIVLEDITLHLHPGEHIALIGANGAGKTTLMRCLLGEYLYQGKITVEGFEPRTHRQRVLHRMGFVPQLPPPLKMPVGQLIHFAAGVCGVNPLDIIELIVKLGLDIQPLLTRPFVKLSGGQKQKVLIAIALGRGSDILMMDEPAANLDPQARQIFFNLLKEKQNHAITLISSHRLDELTSLVNRVIELDRGKIILDKHLVSSSRRMREN